MQVRAITGSLMKVAVSLSHCGRLLRKSSIQPSDWTERGRSFSAVKDMHIIKECKQKSKQIINSYMFGKHTWNYTKTGYGQLCTCWRDILNYHNLRILKGWWSSDPSWTQIQNGNHFMKLRGEVIRRTGQGLGFSAGGCWWPRERALGGGGARRRPQGAALALQLLLLGPPGPAPRAPRAGVRRGAEHLFKAASAVVCPAYFRLKWGRNANVQLVHPACDVPVKRITLKFRNTYFFFLRKDVKGVTSFNRVLECHSCLGSGTASKTLVLYSFSSALFIPSTSKHLNPFRSISRSVDLHCLHVHPVNRCNQNVTRF